MVLLCKRFRDCTRDFDVRSVYLQTIEYFCRDFLRIQTAKPRIQLIPALSLDFSMGPRLIMSLATGDYMDEAVMLDLVKKSPGMPSLNQSVRQLRTHPKCKVFIFSIVTPHNNHKTSKLTLPTTGKVIFISSEFKSIFSVLDVLKSSVMRSPTRSHSREAIDR